MARALTLGNGQLVIGLDDRAQVRDLYFPYVGFENHIGGHNKHRVGVWVDGTLHWLSDPAWRVTLLSHENTFSGETTAANQKLGITLTITDTVYNERNIFLRRVVVKNTRSVERDIRVFFAHQFEPYESHLAHTAFYDPVRRAIVHYRGRRVFLMNARIDDAPLSEYTTGEFGINGKEGSHIDAEDGALSHNSIEHGPADSVMGLYATYAAGQERTVEYWMGIATSFEEAYALDDYVLTKSPDHLIRTAHNFWRAWVNRRDFTFHGLEPDVVSLFKTSLFIIRAHTDNGGAIIASTDSSILQMGKDNYDYMWPRDGARTAVALYRAGSYNTAKRFFLFANDILTNDGYFMHKYGPDKTLGSSWHPWVRDGLPSLPIQEDETALVLHALWDYYELSKDIEFIEHIYNSLIRKSAEFMVSFRDDTLRLPRPTYDLWEEKYGIHTFTACSVYAALIAAGKFAALLGKEHEVRRYHTAATEIQNAIVQHMFDATTGLCYKMITIEEDGTLVPDKTFDMSSVYALYAFDVLPVTDTRLVQNIAAVEERLSIHTDIGGIVRYENDWYRRVSEEVPGNPWVITTCWLAQYYIKRAENEADMEKVKAILNWCTDHATRSNMLPEQLHPFNGTPISATPLTWSHAAFVITVIEYLNKLEELGICDMCNPVK